MNDGRSGRQVATAVPDDRPPERATSRAIFVRFAVYSLILATLVAGIAWPLYARYERGLRNAAIAEEMQALDSVDELVHAELFAVTREIRSLARVPGVRAFLASPSAQGRQELDAFFASLALSLLRYDQMRLLGMDGVELVRVEYRDATLRTVAAEDLRDRSSRPYVQETLALDVEGVYVSPLDLHVEGESVEVPYVPVLRFGTLVPGRGGEPIGMAILNYNAQLLLDTIAERLRIAPGSQHFLVNAEGYFLLGPSRDAEWGWMVGRPDETLASRFPAIAAEAAAGNGREMFGTLRTDDGVALFQTMDPLDFRSGEFPGATSASDMSIAEVSLDRARWTFVTLLPDDVVLAASPVRQPLGWFTLGLVIVLMLLSSYAVASSRAERIAFQRVLEHDLREIEDLYENAPVGYHTTDATGRIRRINRTELAWLGYDRDEVVGRMTLVDLMAPDSREAAEAFLNKIRDGENVQEAHLVMRRKDGSTVPVALSSTTLAAEGGLVAIARTSAVDISERRRLESELTRRAHTDALTGLMNRRRFLEVAAVTLARSRAAGTPVSLLQLDIDHFKSINDRYGHQVGDEALSSFARTCQAQFRDRDLFARIGGEEFAILLPGATLETARAIAQRLCAAVAAAPVRLEKLDDVALTCSVGVAEAGIEDRGLEDLMRRADEFLYEAKAGGRNRVCG